ncbi:MAG: GNAT family N-acetyltransferase [Caldivirga sp.]|uniref:GNAT family N-acetyltransferase n=1 Tax=Caldivirga sp. TaxID=2080243 RepID=UPI003D0FCFD4
MLSLFNALNRSLLSILKRHYLENPVQYVYLMYDILYYPEYTELYLNLSGSRITGYVLFWRGYVSSMHVFGNVREIPIDIKDTGNIVVHALTKPDITMSLIEKLNAAGGGVYVSRLLTMTCNDFTFKEYTRHSVRRLGLQDADEFVKIINVDKAEAKARLTSPHWHYYGAFINNKLVSVGGTYIKLPELWVIGDVTTLPEYRNMGLAKSVVSAIVKDALRSGAMAMLHVDENNEPALRAYREIGFHAVQEFLLIKETSGFNYP